MAVGYTVKTAAMKTDLLLTTIALLVFQSIGSARVGSKKKPISVQKAIQQGIIKASFKGVGGYSGDVIEMDAQNLLNDSVYVVVEAGRKLDSQKEDEQDIMIMKPTIMAFAKKQQKKSLLNGYCCQATNHAPSINSKFEVGKMADSSFVRLSKVLAKKQYGKSDIQNAVWCLSNNYPVSNVSKSLTDLREFLAVEKGIPDPWYQTEMVVPEDGRITNNQVSKIYGNMTYFLRNDCALTIQLLDHNGHLIQTFSSNKLLQRGTYDYWFELSVTNFPKGKYFVRVMGDTQEVMKKEFVI
jgi:hypothetical protein